MAKINQANQGEADMFKYAKPRPHSLPGSAVRNLFETFGIEGNFAADLAGFYLGYSRQTIHAMMSRTIRTNDYELLHHCLTMWKIQRMADDVTFGGRHGPVRADGKRHKRADYENLGDDKRTNNREYMRDKRAENPQAWRTPEARAAFLEAQRKRRAARKQIGAASK